jgi:hypothetical protein
LYHASVSSDSLFKRKCLDHRPNILQNAKGERVSSLSIGVPVGAAIAKHLAAEGAAVVVNANSSK